MRYDAETRRAKREAEPAVVEIHFNARPARAQSVARQWEKIVTVSQVTLVRLGARQAWSELTESEPNVAMD